MVKKIELKPMPKTAVNVTTIEEYDRLIRIYTAAGWNWPIGFGPTDGREFWERYRGITCIAAEHPQYSPKGVYALQYGDRRYFKGRKYKILSFQEFLKTQNLTKADLLKCLTIKVNTYFEGDVKSLSVGENITVGSILPGEYEFTAGPREETMIMIHGSAEVQHKGKTEWGIACQGDQFKIKPKQSFRIRCTEPVSYKCIYSKPKKK